MQTHSWLDRRTLRRIIETMPTSMLLATLCVAHESFDLIRVELARRHEAIPPHPLARTEENERRPVEEGEVTP